nr:amino acid permease [Fibrella sp. ES10-3-2-2]
MLDLNTSTPSNVPESTPPAGLPRRLSLIQGTALNMIDMVGIGPFVVLPLVMKSIGGPHFLLAWALGALISIIDALVWSELGAAFPQAGGSYQFLKISYGEQKWGKLLSFLYVWQTLIQAPLVVASGAIGFAQYASYLYPLDEVTRRIVSGTVVLLVIALLYRRIDGIGRISVLLWLCVLGTMGWLIVGGLYYGTRSVGTLLSDAWTSAETVSPTVLAASIGVASVKTIYCYLGYYNICHLGGEIQKPERNIPLSMFLSVIGIAILYGLLNLSVASVLPFEKAANSPFIVSTMVEALYGSGAARFATLLVLVVAFSSLFAVLLGYSRVPYAAAADGQFFSMFAKLHPTREFPYISLLFLGGLAFIFSLLFKLANVITAILAMRVVVQFIGQAVGLLLLHRKRTADGQPAVHFPFRMPLYPLPVILVIAVWGYIFYSTGTTYMLSGMTVTALGTIAYLLVAKARGWWPFR